MLDVARYAYHRGELAAAIRHLDREPESADAVVLRVKALCELDQAGLAGSYAELAARAYPDMGLLHYHRGMAQYLAGRDAGDLETAFRAALDAGHRAGHLGMGFLAYAAGELDRAMEALAQAHGDDPELEHVRCLMMCQVAMDGGRFAEAEGYLFEADQVLRSFPSLLRAHWGQVCWIRLLNASGAFEAAKALLTSLTGQLSAERTPRLHRNATDLARKLAVGDGASEVFLPGRGVVRRLFLPLEIARKPTLSSLFHFLRSRGESGATKEDIVRHVWAQDYNPLAHDDRLYKAIGRLRKLVEESAAGPSMLYLRGAHYVLTEAVASPELVSEGVTP